MEEESVFHSLLEWDKNILLFLNGSDYPFWDQFMWIYTGKLIWLPFFLALIYIIIKNQSIKSALFIFLMIGAVIALADQISSSFFKPYFQRFRPSHEPEIMHLVQLVNDYKGGRYGFISSHAANSFGLATFMSLLIKRKVFTFSIIIWAIINCYSRMYLGVHYPGDILVGALVGWVIACLVYLFYKSINNKYFYKIRNSHSLLYTKSGFLISDINIVIITLLSTFLFIILLSIVRVM